MAKDKKKTGSIDDITPEQWNEMNRLRLEEVRDSKENDKVVNIEYDTCNDIGFPEDTFTLSVGDITADSIPFTLHTDDTVSYTIKEPINYKFNEGVLMAEFKDYIDSTYSGHYGQGGLQSSEIIVDRGHGMGFFSGNVDKYNGRYGKKGETPADYRKDILKIIHYGFLMLYEHDRIHGNTTD